MLRGGARGAVGGGGYYGGVGIKSLDDNLRKAGVALNVREDGVEGGKGGGDAMSSVDEDWSNLGVKMKDWDEARKEVRAMKGMLLSR